MPALDKAQIERQFQRAANSYDEAAELQREIFLKLNNMIEPYVGQPDSIADLGCGTGFGLAQLRKQFKDTTLSGVDISQAMLERSTHICPDAELIKADMESLPLNGEQFDLVISSSSLQWCDPDKAISEFARILRPDGHLAIATFGPGTHQEWKAAWSNADRATHTLDFPSLAEIERIFDQQNIKLVAHDKQMRVLRFNSTQEVLQSVKDLGATNANNGRQRGLMGKARFGRFLKALEQASSPPQLSYEIFFLIGQKPF